MTKSSRKLPKTWTAIVCLSVATLLAASGGELCGQCEGDRCPRPGLFRFSPPPPQQHRYAWPKSVRKLRLAYDLQGVNLDQATVDRIADQVCRIWSEACGMDLQVVSPGERPNIVTRAGPLRPGVLGWSSLPVGQAGQVIQQTLATNVTWTPDWFARVWLHELGHALGLGHSPDDIRDVMYPSQSARGNGGRTLADYPGPNEAALLVERYGPPDETLVPIPIVAPVPDSTPGGPQITRAEFEDVIRRLGQLEELARMIQQKGG